VRLDDLQIERYSRQIVLPEVGAEGQLRLLAARVAIAGTGVAAERVLAYLAAAGVGTIEAAPSLHWIADPGQTDVTVGPLATGGHEAPRDVAVFAGEWDLGSIAARHSLWTAAGRAGEIPPCPSCAEAALPEAPAVPGELRALRDALLGTVVATEVVKAILGIGTPLRGLVLRYDPGSGSVTVGPAAARPGCPTCAASAAHAGAR